MNLTIPAHILDIDPLYGLNDFFQRQKDRIKSLATTSKTGPVADQLEVPESRGTLAVERLTRRLSPHAYTLESRT